MVWRAFWYLRYITELQRWIADSASVFWLIVYDQLGQLHALWAASLKVPKLVSLIDANTDQEMADLEGRSLLRDSAGYQCRLASRLRAWNPRSLS